MSTATAAFPIHETSPADLPRTFREAIQHGWTVCKEQSAIDIRERRRKGTLLLQRRGSPVRLRIAYVATRKGWQFAAPKTIE